jgi:hypothetical protein
VELFFKSGFGKNLADYECELEPHFDLPLTALCAYTVDDISTYQTDTIDRLQEHHTQTWA